MKQPQQTHGTPETRRSFDDEFKRQAVALMETGRPVRHLARELEVSPRTVHRLMESLSLANVPWFFCKQTGAYKVRKGFRFPGIDGNDPDEPIRKPEAALAAVDGVLAELTRFTEALRGYRNELAALGGQKPPTDG